MSQSGSYFEAMFYIPKEDIEKADLRKDLRIQSNKGYRGSLLTVDCWSQTPTHYKVPLPWALSRGFEGQDKTPRIKRKWPKIGMEYWHNQKEVSDAAIKGSKKKELVE